MAEVGTVFDATAAPRTSADILPVDDTERAQIHPGPVTSNKWLTASVVADAASVVAQIFAEADRRDPDHDRTWVALLDGKATRVAGAIRRAATIAGLHDAQRAGADACAVYLTNKAHYLDYPTALASGWPIATGVIEGACRHLVKDRMDLTGARWGLPGAEAILKTARHRQQRRLRRLLAPPPRPGTSPRPRDPLRPRRHPTGSVRSLQKSRTHPKMRQVS